MINVKKNFYLTFQKWVTDSYGQELSAEQWREIMEEDSGTSYVTEPTTEGSDHDPAADDNNNLRPQSPQYYDDYYEEQNRSK